MLLRSQRPKFCRWAERPKPSESSQRVRFGHGYFLMYHFTGDHVSRKKVDLRGRSRGEENRHQVLQRTRREREKRRRQKLEAESATRIQAWVRCLFAVRDLKNQFREEWVSQYGSAGERLDSSCLSVDTHCLSKLLFSVDMAEPQDLQRLAAFCRLLLTTYNAPGQLLFCSLRQFDRSVLPTVLHRAKKLLEMCLRALSANRYHFIDSLAEPGSSLQNETESAGPHTFVNAILTLSNPAAWSHAVGKDTAESLARGMITHLVQRGMYTALSNLLRVSSNAERARWEGQGTVAEVLTLELSRRHAQLVPLRTIEMGSSRAGVDRGPLQILSIPGLWARCPVVREVGGWLCVFEFLQRRSLDAVGVVRALSRGGRDVVEVALALLGNIGELGKDAVVAAGLENQPDLFQKVSLALSQFMYSVLVRLPLEKLFGVDMDEDGHASEPGASGSAEDEVGTWDVSGPVDGAMLQSASSLFSSQGRALIEGLIGGVLPRVSHGNTTSGNAQNGDMAQGLFSVCGLLQLVLKNCSLFERQRFFLELAISGQLVERLWFGFLREAWRREVSSGLAGGVDALLLPLNVLCKTYSCFLVTAGAEEVCGKQEPLPLVELYDGDCRDFGLIAMLKQCMWQVVWLSKTPYGLTRTEQALRSEFEDSAGKLLSQLHECNARWNFAPPEAFHVQDVQRFVGEATRVATALDDSRDVEVNQSARAWTLLNHAPCIIPFQERANVFQAQIEHDRLKHRDPMRMFLDDGNKFITIRRNQLLYDGFNQLNELKDDLKRRVRIQFIDEHGLAEAGVDGGGLFKDFMEELVRQGFDSQYGLFSATDDNQLYPNPASVHVQEDALDLLAFLGRMLGKAVYEGILLELPLAGFFLKKFRSSYCNINDLPSLDPEMYRSLLTLKSYPGNVADLCLNFTMVDSAYGANREVELKPGGQDIAVTNKNAVEYIHLVADYKLNRQVKSVCRAFLAGFFEVIRPEWVRMFSAAELQNLISGSQEGLDLVDMQRNVEYGGGYDKDHPVIQKFWESLHSFSPEEQHMFLKFVTACSRAPLLGFKYLQPKMCIQMAGSVLDEEAKGRLPTAATCMNLLKLPPYDSGQTMREKLLYAVNSRARFDLS